MRRMWTPVVVLLAVLAVGAIDQVWYLPRLPARVATHFDSAGRPNGWMTPGQLVSFDVVVLAILLAAMLGGPVLVRFLPPSLINIPNRDHWLAPERRRESQARLVRHGLWLSGLTCAMFVAINHLVFRANTSGAPPHLSTGGIVSLIALYLAAVAGWTVRLYRLFPRPPGRG